MPDIVFLDAGAILAIWDDVRQVHGVGLPCISEERLEGALGRVVSNYLYADPEPTVPQLAGCLGYSLAKSHPFGDGNKRTALIAMEIFLLDNGWVNHAGDIRTAKMVEWAIRNSISEESFIRLLERHCVFYGDEVGELDV